jgi:hypothetical protein
MIRTNILHKNGRGDQHTREESALEGMERAEWGRQCGLEGNELVTDTRVEASCLSGSGIHEWSQGIDGLLNLGPTECSFITITIRRIDRLSHTLDAGDFSIGPPTEGSTLGASTLASVL